MHKWQGNIFILGFLIVGKLAAETDLKTVVQEEAAKPPFVAFTGKITKNKVRLRATPATDAPIIKELAQGELLIVLGEEEDFYAVQPPQDSKGFVFRTFVLEGNIEGSKVNVRLEPNTEAQVIAQLNSGDKVEGRVSPLSNKWLEISVPETVRFFVAKDFVKKAGDKNYMALMHKKSHEVNQLLTRANETSLAAYKSDFPHINYESVVAGYERVIASYPEFEEQKAKAETNLGLFKENYLKMKIAHLEAKSGRAGQADKLQEEKLSLEEKMREQQQRLAALEQQVHVDSLPIAIGSNPLWMNHEKNLYLSWMENEGSRPMDVFYQEQRMNGSTLKGTIEPYLKKVKNKPGDYILLNQQGRAVAFLYSTVVNLQELVGKETIFFGSTRPNNDFALPAYFVLSVE